MRPDLARCRRKASLTVLNHLFNCLTAWLAPILVFTMEEVWLERHPGEDSSVHLRLFPEVPAEWLNHELAAKWQLIRSVRRVVTGALEIERREKRIGSSLEAAPKVYISRCTAPCGPARAGPGRDRHHLGHRDPAGCRPLRGLPT